MKKYSKILLAASAIILLAAACSQTQPRVNNQQAITAPTSAPPAGQTQTGGNPDGLDNSPNGREPDAPNPVTVYQTVQGSNLNDSYGVVEGFSAIALLKMAHKTDIQSYSGIGEMVLSIDGIKPDSRHFWAFYVNGKSSNVGASSYKLQPNDKIEWKLEEIK